MELHIPSKKIKQMFIFLCSNIVFLVQAMIKFEEIKLTKEQEKMLNEGGVSIVSEKYKKYEKMGDYLVENYLDEKRRKKEQNTQEHDEYITCLRMIESGGYDIELQTKIIQEMCEFCSESINKSIFNNKSDSIVTILIKRYEFYGAETLSVYDVIKSKNFVSTDEKKGQLKNLFQSLIKKGALITSDVKPRKISNAPLCTILDSLTKSDKKI